MIIELLNNQIKEPKVLAELIVQATVGDSELLINQPLWEEDENTIYYYGICPKKTDAVLQVLGIGKRWIDNVLVDYVTLRNSLDFEIPMNTELQIVNLLESFAPGMNFSITRDSFKKNTNCCWIKTECDNVNEYGVQNVVGNLLESEVSAYEPVATTVLTHLDFNNRVIGFDSTGLPGIVEFMELKINDLNYSALSVDDGTVTLSSPLPPLDMARVVGTVNQYPGNQTELSTSFDTGTDSNSHNHNYTSPDATTDVNNQDHTHNVGSHRHSFPDGNSIIPYRDENFTPIEGSFIEINGMKYQIATVDTVLKEITIYGHLQSTIYDDNIIRSYTYPPTIPILAAKWRVRANTIVPPIISTGFGLFRVKFQFSEAEGGADFTEIEYWFYRATPSCVVQNIGTHKYRVHFNMVNLEIDEEYKLIFSKGLQDYFKTQVLNASEKFKAGENNNE